MKDLGINTAGNTSSPGGDSLTFRMGVLMSNNLSDPQVMIATFSKTPSNHLFSFGKT